MLKLLMLCAAFFVVSCAGSVSRNPERTYDVMTTFVQRAQAGFWKEAMDTVTPSEREEMMDGGQLFPEYKEAISRLRLSTFKNMDLGLDSKGRLVGIKDVLDGSNDMVRPNADRVDIDPRKLEDLAAQQEKRDKELAERRKKEQEEESQKEEKEEDSGSFLESLLKQAPKEW
jgi:hypothetical protein